MQTLRAGDGFLSQSSKWLHFGLGEDLEPGHVVVHWPGGTKQTFTGLQTDARWVLREGTQTPRKQTSRRPIDLARQRSTTDDGSASPSSRTLLSRPLPLPQMVYTQQGASQPTPMARPNEATLLCVWAPWCRPCREELVQLTSQTANLAEKDLRVVAVRLESVTRSEDAQEFLERIDFPHEEGTITTAVLERLQLLHDWLFFRTDPLPLPVSFLVFDQKLAAIYKGSVKTEQVVQDLQRYRAEPELLQNSALPFPGRWLLPERNHRVLWVAAKLMAQGDLPGTIDYLDRFASEIGDDPDLGPARLRIGMALLGQRQATQAAQQLGEAARLMPRDANAQFAFGTALEVLGDSSSATRQFEVAADIDATLVASLHRQWAGILRNNQRSELAQLHERAAKDLSDDR